MGFNPRYAAYAKAHGKTPHEMLEQDRINWPGGCMCGFICWMSEKNIEFYKACPSAFLDRFMIDDQEAWTKFLEGSI